MTGMISGILYAAVFSEQFGRFRGGNFNLFMTINVFHLFIICLVCREATTESGYEWNETTFLMHIFHALEFTMTLTHDQELTIERG